MMVNLSDKDLEEVWAAQLELRLRPDTGEYAKGFRGAFTTVLVRCADVTQFVTSAVSHIEREGFTISGVERLFPLGSGHIEINEAVADLAIRTRQYPLQWTTFHMFKDD
jgi:hypothetical protein